MLKQNSFYSQLCLLPLSYHWAPLGRIWFHLLYFFPKIFIQIDKFPPRFFIFPTKQSQLSPSFLCDTCSKPLIIFVSPVCSCLSSIGELTTKHRCVSQGCTAEQCSACILGSQAWKEFATLFFQKNTFESLDITGDNRWFIGDCETMLNKEV